MMEEVMHKHRCNGCRTVWEHSGRARNLAEYHACPKCGKEQWAIYTGDGPAEITQAVVRPKRAKAGRLVEIHQNDLDGRSADC